MLENSTYIPFDITGGVIVGDVASTANYTLSGFTCDLTKFKFNIGNAVPSYISDDKFIWNLGDGTVVTGISAEHVYRVPGIYNVSLIAYSSGGDEYLSTLTQQVSVSDFYKTYIERDTTNVFNTVKIYNGRLDGRSNTPIKINRYTSWQPHNSLSASGYTLSLYASGSSAKKLIDRQQTDKWRHVENTWNFYSPVTADYKIVSYEPVDSILTTNEEIYYKEDTRLFDPGGLDTPYYVQQFKRVKSSKVATTSGTVLVGTSGVGNVYYSDDSVSPDIDPIFVYVSLDISKFPDFSSIINPKYSLSFTPSYRSYSKLTIPVRTISTPAKNIKFTTTGLTTMPLTGSRWQMTSIPFFVNLTDANDTIVKNHPPLTIKPIRSGITPSTDSYVVNLSVVDSNQQLLSANFFKYNDDQLPDSLSGMYRGYFVPVEHSDGAQLLGEVSLRNSPGFAKDTTVTIIGNPTFRSIYTIALPNTKYVVNDETGIVTRTTLDTTTRAASSDTLAFAVVPDDNTIENARSTSYLTDSTNDTISALNTYSTPISCYNLRSIPIGTADPTRIDLIDYSSGSTTNLAPSNISLDKTRKLWVTCNDAALTVGIDTVSAVVTDIIQQTSNVTYLSAVTGTSGFTLSGMGGHNLYEPGIVETTTDNNVWIAYTNPLSSFVEKYEVTSAGASLAVKYEMPYGVGITDMVVDGSNNVWLSTVNQLRQARASYTTNVSAYGSTELRYYTGANSLADWQVGEIVESDWSYGCRRFSGQGLIAARDDSGTDLGWYVDVHPYTGRMTQIFDTTGGALCDESTTIKVYPSDTIYKLDNNGTKLATISGFYKPGYLTVDGNQNCWVIHDSNKLTQIDTDTNTVSTTIRCETSEWLTSNASSDLLAFNNAQLGGVNCDTFNRVLVINTYENKLMYFDTTTPSTSAAQNIDTAPLSSSNMFRSLGDWTGFRWLNKYFNAGAGTTVSVSGASTINIYPSGGKYNVAKLNENFDPADTIKSYRFQPQLIDDNVFFDDFYGQIVGDLSGAPTDLGRAIYEKIANFNSNNTDIETCNLNTLYSLCEEIDYEINNYNFTYTGGLRRIMDLLSIQHKKLWGDRSKYDRDFEKYGTVENSSLGINLGTELDATTYTVSAGVPFVAQQLFNRQYRIVNPMYLSGSNTDPGYDSSVGMLKTYPLSSFSPNWGWGLYNDTTGTDIIKYYNFYEYKSTPNNVQVEGIIDWQNPYTNLNESLSSIEVWTKDEGYVQSMIDFELRKGLNLFHSVVSGDNV